MSRYPELESVNTDDILVLLDDADTTPLTTPQVATQLGISQRAAWVYLTRLAEDDLVKREVGRDLKMDTWAITEAGQAVIAETAG